MNILPLILALVFMLSVLTIERLEKFKNQSVIQREYQVFLEKNERLVFNQRQKKLFDKRTKKNAYSLRQLSFRYFMDKKARDKNPNVAKQYRILVLDLMRNLYGESFFFKKMERKRQDFLEELLTAIEEASDEGPEGNERRIQDLARLKLEDPELQKVFYHMLKGTITRDEWIKIKNIENISPKRKGKAYVSLFTFINNFGNAKVPKIRVALAPREILKTIFLNDQVVEEIIERRSELGKKKEDGSQAMFKNEFLSKIRPGIDENLLDFKLSKKSDQYN